MKPMNRLFLLSWLLLIGLMSPLALAEGPSKKKVEADILSYWKEHWPDQVISKITKKSDCQKAESDGAKGQKQATCQIKVDVLVARGYRLLAYRDTFAQFRGGKLKAILLGDLEKSWKEGGVPAPTQEKMIRMLVPLAAEKLGAADPQIALQEIGRPRPYDDFYRVTGTFNVRFQKDNQDQSLERVLVTFQSDGGDWTVVSDLAF
jgi:hypothetical protein